MSSCRRGLLGAIATPTDTYIVPALIAHAGDAAGWRYIEFFTANIRNPHTRRAYARACSRFLAWCEDRGLTLTIIRPFDVGAWAVYMLFDRLIMGQVVLMSPALAVRGPKHVVKTGTTPVLDAAEWRKLCADWKSYISGNWNHRLPRQWRSA